MCDTTRFLEVLVIDRQSLVFILALGRRLRILRVNKGRLIKST